MKKLERWNRIFKKLRIPISHTVTPHYVTLTMFKTPQKFDALSTPSICFKLCPFATKLVFQLSAQTDVRETILNSFDASSISKIIAFWWAKEIIRLFKTEITYIVLIEGNKRLLKIYKNYYCLTLIHNLNTLRALVIEWFQFIFVFQATSIIFQARTKSLRAGTTQNIKLKNIKQQQLLTDVKSLIKNDWWA